jgi:hypothetical protein
MTAPKETAKSRSPYDPTQGNCKIKVSHMTVFNPAESFRKRKVQNDPFDR